MAVSVEAFKSHGLTLVGIRIIMTHKAVITNKMSFTLPYFFLGIMN